jgi:CheY-like chemotaxis protein
MRTKVCDTPQGPRTPSQKRLLLVDDEEAILRPLARYVTKLDWQVTTAREAEEAEALLKHREFDLLILDLELSRFGRGGLALMTSARKTRRDLPVIVLSAFVEPEVEETAFRLGADGVLRKPCLLPELASLAFRLVGLAQ